jgi:hypothetical protein
MQSSDLSFDTSNTSGSVGGNVMFIKTKTKVFGIGNNHNYTIAYNNKYDSEKKSKSLRVDFTESFFRLNHLYQLKIQLSKKNNHEVLAVDAFVSQLCSYLVDSEGRIFAAHMRNYQHDSQEHIQLAPNLPYTFNANAIKWFKPNKRFTFVAQLEDGVMVQRSFHQVENKIDEKETQTSKDQKFFIKGLKVHAGCVAITSSRENEYIFIADEKQNCIFRFLIPPFSKYDNQQLKIFDCNQKEKLNEHVKIIPLPIDLNKEEKILKIISDINIPDKNSKSTSFTYIATNKRLFRYRDLYPLDNPWGGQHPDPLVKDFEIKKETLNEIAIPNIDEHNLVEISAGDNHIVTLSDDGKVYSWGSNKEGQVNPLDEKKQVFYQPTEIHLNDSGVTEKTIHIYATGSATILQSKSKLIVYGSNTLKKSCMDENKKEPIPNVVIVDLNVFYQNNPKKFEKEQKINDTEEEKLIDDVSNESFNKLKQSEKSSSKSFSQNDDKENKTIVDSDSNEKILNQSQQRILSSSKYSLQDDNKKEEKQLIDNDSNGGFNKPQQSESPSLKNLFQNNDKKKKSIWKNPWLWSTIISATIEVVSLSIFSETYASSGKFFMQNAHPLQNDSLKQGICFSLSAIIAIVWFFIGIYKYHNFRKGKDVIDHENNLLSNRNNMP